jgi:hypothetical protein
MSEIKREIKVNPDGSYTITDDHSIADIVRWLLTQESKETIMYVLEKESAQRTWVGLTQDELNMIGDRMIMWNSHSLTDVYVAIEAKLKEKNS